MQYQVYEGYVGQLYVREVHSDFEIRMTVGYSKEDLSSPNYNEAILKYNNGWVVSVINASNLELLEEYVRVRLNELNA